MAQSTMIEPVRASVVNANLFKNVIPPPPAEEKLVSYLRIRPIPVAQESPFHVCQDKRLMARPPKESKAYKNLKDGETGVRSYLFNHIFDEKCSQEEFYAGTALPLVHRAIKGESSLLFAYGTTNSGKSFTMRGTSDHHGIIPRALNDIFAFLGDRVTSTPMYKPGRFAEADALFDSSLKKEKGLSKFIMENSLRTAKNTETYSSFLSLSKSITESFASQDEILSQDLKDQKFDVWVSYLEFYMDNLRDLLAIGEEGKKAEQLLLCSDSNDNYYVKGLRHIQVSNVNEAYKCLIYAWDSIHKAATLLNQDSSRSHSIFTITLIAYDTSSSSSSGRCPIVSNLSFCDLAGSERGNRTNNTGDRLKEAAKINNSLMVLKQCVNALRVNQKSDARPQVVPFRNSPLTKFFKSYFNGSGFATMIININPSKEYYDETLISLQFSVDASDLTVPPKETRLRLKNSICRLTQSRLTQQWLESGQNWSSFAPVSTRDTTSLMENTETDETEDSESCEYKSQLEQTLLENINPDVIDLLAEHIEEINDKFEKDKIVWEMQIRKDVADKLQKIHLDQINDKDEEIAELKKQREADIAKIEDWYKKRCANLKRELQVKTEECAKSNETNETLESQVIPLKNEIASLKQTNNQLQEENEKLLHSAAAHDNEKEKLNQQVSEMQHEMGHLESMLSECQNENEKLKKEMSKLSETYEKQILQLKEQSQTLTLSKKESSNQVQLLCDKIKSLESTIEKHVQTISILEKQISASKVDSATSDIDSAEEIASAPESNTISSLVPMSAEDSFKINVEAKETRKRKQQQQQQPVIEARRDLNVDAYLNALRKNEIEATPAPKTKRKKTKPVEKDDDDDEDKDAKDPDATLISEDESSDDEDELGLQSRSTRSTRTGSSRVTRSRALKVSHCPS